MKIRESINSFLEKIVNNNDKIWDNNEKIRIIKANQFNYKIKIFTVFAGIGYLGLSCLLTLVDFFNLPSILPSHLFPIIAYGGAIGIGCLAEKSINREDKEKLKSFSDARTEIELLEEEVKREIELEKTTNKNNAYKEAIEFSGLTSTNLIVGNIDRIQNKIDELKRLFEEKLAQLDTISAQKLLYEKACIARKFQPNLKSCLLRSLAIVFLFLNLSNILNAIQLETSISSTILTVLTSYIVVNGYSMMATNNLKKVLSKLTSEVVEKDFVDEKELPSDAFCRQGLIIEKNLKESMREIIAISIQLQEFEKTLEVLLEKEEEKKKVKYAEHIPSNNYTYIDSETLDSDLTFEMTDEITENGEKVFTLRPKRAR